jgi:hypothetical protein
VQRATRLLHRAEAANKRTANQGGHILRQLELFLRWSFFVHRTRVIFLLLVLATQIAPSCRLPESKAPGRSVQAQHSVFAMPGDRMACGRSTQAASRVHQKHPFNPRSDCSGQSPRKDGCLLRASPHCGLLSRFQAVTKSFVIFSIPSLIIRACSSTSDVKSDPSDHNTTS